MNIEGLIPAIVQEYTSGRVLMLAYVNQESYDQMLATGETCFWSRSRKALWHKGETSGNVQKVRRIAFDCDRDTLLIQVEQTGDGACHTGSLTCFGDEEPGAFYTLRHLYDTIAKRKEQPEEKSYTQYLLREGTDKICKKMGEEAAEVIIAAKNLEKTPAAEEKTAFVGEIADLVYHMLVLMYTRDVTWEDVLAELGKRRAVEGNLKKPRDGSRG